MDEKDLFDETVTRIEVKSSEEFQLIYLFDHYFPVPFCSEGLIRSVCVWGGGGGGGLIYVAI